MAKTVVGTFDSVVDAETAADALASSGLDPRAMAVIDNKAGRLGRGAVFLVVTVADGQAVRVEDLMRRAGAQDVQAPSGSTGGAADEGEPRVRVYTHTWER